MDRAISKTGGRPFEFKANQNLFPVRRKEAGGSLSDSVKEKAIALLLPRRENIVNAVTFATSNVREDNLVYDGVMEIEIEGKIELYAYTAQNAKPFDNRAEMVEKGITANETKQEGFSLRGQGMKLPQAYLNVDTACELVLCSKTPSGFHAAVSRYTPINVKYDSNTELDKFWETKLRSRFGEKVFNRCNNFVLHRISPFFSGPDAKLGALRMHLHDLCGSILEKVTLFSSEGVLPEGTSLSKAQYNTYRYQMHSASEQRHYFVCKDDEGTATVEKSTFVSPEYRIVIEDSKVKFDFGMTVTIEPLPMLYTNGQIAHLINEDNSSTSAYRATMRTGLRSEEKGSGNENGVKPLLNLFVTASAIATENPELPQLRRFLDGPIAFLRHNQMGDVYRALGLPVYPKLVPRLKTKSGKMVVHANPTLRIHIDITKVYEVIDKETGEKSDALSLIGNLGIRGDFVMPHNTSGGGQYVIGLRDQIIDATCRAAAGDVAKSFLPDWCKERFEKVEPNLYKFKSSLCESSSKKETRHITKYDLATWASDYQLHVHSGMETFVAFQDDTNGKFLSASVDGEYRSTGCYTQQIHVPFEEYLLNWAEERKSAIAHAVTDPKERRAKIREIQALEENLAKSYRNLCNSKNGGEPITIYQVKIDQLAYIDSSKRLIPFDAIERTKDAVEELLKKSS